MPAAYEPAGAAVQAAALVDVVFGFTVPARHGVAAIAAVVATYVPAGAGVQFDAPLVELKVPVVHGMGLVLAPTVNVPAGVVVQDVLPVPAEYVPAGQPKEAVAPTPGT